MNTSFSFLVTKMDLNVLLIYQRALNYIYMDYTAKHMGLVVMGC